jgi:acetolactate synthase I/II/III large subunit
MDVNSAIVKILEQVGVDHVFGGSGQVNGSMLLALKKSTAIKTVIIRNEQAASFMACGYAMYSDKLGVCFATGGPGAFNLFSGLAVAYSDSLPVLAISGYASKPVRGKGALNESSGINRTPDSHAMFSATTKKSFIIEDPATTCDILEEAINTAYEGRPGPVHIHIPKNITVAEVPNFRPIAFAVKQVLPDTTVVDKAVDALAAALKAGDNVMALIGYGCIRSHAEKQVLQLVERFQIPFATTMDAKGILSEEHPLSLGVYGTSGDPGATEYFASATTVIALGNSFAENATLGFRKELYDGKTLIHVNIDPAEIGKVYAPAVGLLSDAKPAVEMITNRLAARVPSAPARKVERKKFHDLPVVYSGSKIHPGEMVKVLSRNLPPNAIIMGDAGSHMLWLSCFLNLADGQHYQNPGSFGPMASHVNGAMGANGGVRVRRRRVPDGRV